MEEKKLIKDRECLHCVKFFDCAGKPTKESCVNYTERDDGDVGSENK